MIQRRTPLKRSGAFRSSPKTRKKRQARNAIIAVTRPKVFTRDPCCRRCKRPGRPDDHMHEVLSRAQLRGRPSAEVFSTTNTLRLCKLCHQLFSMTIGVTREQILYDDPALGCDGPIRCVPKTPKSTLWKTIP